LRTSTSTLATLAATLTLVLAPLTPESASAGSAGADLAVTAYALPSVRPSVVRRDADALDTLTLVGSVLRASGRGVRPAADDVDDLAAVAHRQGLAAELLLSNYSNALGDFDRRALHRMLEEPAHRQRVARQLARQARKGGWDGVNVDLELVPRHDAKRLVDFLRRLRAELPATATLSIDVSGSTSPSAYRHRGYRLNRIAKIVDVVQLMTYDQHGPGWSGPGPVGSLRWTRDCLDAAVEAGVPAARLDLGVAGYGYLWRRDGSGRTITPRAARRLVREAGVQARWRARAGEWTARLPDGRRLWWSDARSFDVRRAVAARRDLHGLAVWRLGSADPLTR